MEHNKLTPTPATMETARALGVIGHYYCDDSWYSCPLAPEGCADDRQPRDKCTCDYEGRINKIATALDAAKAEQREVDAKLMDAKVFNDNSTDIVSKFYRAAAKAIREGGRHE